MDAKRVMAVALKLAMLVLALWWLFLWWLFPTDEWAKVVEPMHSRMKNDAYGEASEYCCYQLQAIAGCTSTGPGQAPSRAQKLSLPSAALASTASLKLKWIYAYSFCVCAKRTAPCLLIAGYSVHTRLVGRVQNGVLSLKA